MTSYHPVSVPSGRLSRRLILMMASLLLAAVARSPAATAADNFWTGGAGNGNFSDNANWQSPPSWDFGNSLVFKANTTAPSLTNDQSWRDNNDIYWDATFPVARTLQSTGNFGLGFKIRLENLSSFTQTVTMPLSGGLNGASQIQINPVNGSLILSGSLYNENSVDYVVFGSQTATVTNLTLNTALGPNASQANVDFIVAGGRNSAIQVNASQLWAGTTDVQSGSLTAASGVTLASSAILVSGGTVATTSANTLADSATLTVNAGGLSIGGSDTVGSLAGSGGTVGLAAGATLTVGGANTNTSYAGSITGSGNLTKVGGGRLALAGANTFSGTATASAGELALNGSLASNLGVLAAATLSGTGTVGGNATIAGIHSPGNSPGIQTFNGNLTYEAGAVVNWELIANSTGSAGTNYDQIVLPTTGNLTFSGSTTLALSFNGAGSSVDWEDPFWDVNRSWMIYDLSAGTTSNLGNLFVGGSLLDSLSQPLSPTQRGFFTTSLVGQDVVLTFTAVPEPSTWALALAGFACGGWMMRRRGCRLLSRLPTDRRADGRVMPSCRSTAL